MENKENHDEEEVLEEENSDVTKEIDLDELYDGSVNNTVVIDPITNSETLMPNKQNNYIFIILVIFSVIALLLYLLVTKSPFGNTTKEVVPETTKTTTTALPIDKNNENGTLVCNYNSKSDAETQEVIFKAIYEENKIVSSEFKFSAITNFEGSSAIIEDLKSQYESLYINNASVIGSNMVFEKNDKGFTFENKTDYMNVDFSKIMVEEGKTVLFVKPALEDTRESLEKIYTEKGFNCTNKTLEM